MLWYSVSLEQKNAYLLTTIFGFGREREHQQHKKDVLSCIVHACGMSKSTCTFQSGHSNSSFKSALFL